MYTFRQYRHTNNILFTCTSICVETSMGAQCTMFVSFLQETLLTRGPGTAWNNDHLYSTATAWFPAPRTWLPSKRWPRHPQVHRAQATRAPTRLSSHKCTLNYPFYQIDFSNIPESCAYLKIASCGLTHSLTSAALFSLWLAQLSNWCSLFQHIKLSMYPMWHRQNDVQ